MTQKKFLGKMNWPRFIGLIQSDGNFYFTYEADGTLRPRVTISVTNKRPAFTNMIANFLLENGFKPTIDVGEDGRATNITIERQENVNRLFVCFERVKGISFFDAKLRDYLVLKHVLVLHKQLVQSGGRDNQSAESNKIRQQIISLKTKTSESRTGPAANTPESLAAKLGLKEAVNLSSGDAMWEAILNTVQATGLKIIQEVRTSSTLPDNVGYFLAGVWDGDGSFQVNFITHVTKTGERVLVKPKNKSPWHRRLYEIKPIITLTDELTTEESLLFRLCALVFEGPLKENPSLYKPGSTKKARRYVCNSAAAQIQRVIPLFEKYGLCIERNVTRFRVYRLVLKNQKYFTTRESRVKYIVNKVYSMPEFFAGEEDRNNKKAYYLSLVERQFILDQK